MTIPVEMMNPLNLSLQKSGLDVTIPFQEHFKSIQARIEPKHDALEARV
jgi:hypothetical protein